MKQLPLITASEKPFWDAARKHELVAYQCVSCGTYYSQTADCVVCDNPRMVWSRVSGKGRVFTFGIFHQLYHPAWKDEIPYNVAWVKLEEGPILLTNIIDCPSDNLKVDLPVEVVFEDVTEEVTLPKFRPLI